MSKGNPILGIRLPKGTLAKLLEVAEAYDEKPSVLARNAIERWLDSGDASSLIPNKPNP